MLFCRKNNESKGNEPMVQRSVSFDKKTIVSRIDEKIGFRIKLRRGMLSLTQEDLAKKLGVTFQQVQKYETGKDRVSSSRLWDLANALDVPVSFFFEDLSSSGASLRFASPKKGEKNPLPLSTTTTKEDDLTSLIRAFVQIKDKSVQKSVLELVKSLTAKK